MLILLAIARPRLLSVPEAAAVLRTSDAYVRRLLLRERLFGVKVGQVWAIYKEDLENFQRLRRPPGRPRKLLDRLTQDGELRRIDDERSDAHTDGFLRKPRRAANPTPTPAGRREA